MKVTFKFGRKIKNKIENFIDVVEIKGDNLSRGELINKAWDIINPNKKYGMECYLNLVSVEGE